LRAGIPSACQRWDIILGITHLGLKCVPYIVELHALYMFSFFSFLTLALSHFLYSVVFFVFSFFLPDFRVALSPTA
jgi:hypothetical protein